MRALVVEDERRLAEGLRRGLEAEGFAVDVAVSTIDGDLDVKKLDGDIAVR
ncbi:hypothetical protein ADILRU_0283 [Leifsonia rubra CMS 76R]|nr:hypothetical protein ADILRU_0283 [Leifsonia rubra CMS 76R]